MFEKLKEQQDKLDKLINTIIVPTYIDAMMVIREDNLQFKIQLGVYNGIHH